jgi:bifunctional non-homologous end joining protein LigD
VHEIKFDGWRCQAHKQGDCVRLFSKKGNDLSHRFPSLARSLRGFAVDTAILDGEVVAVDKNGRPDFAALFTAEPERVQFWAFDLLEVDGRVLAISPLLERRRDLTRVFENAPEGCLLSETFEDAKALLRAADRFGLEGIVSKRKDMGYRSGTSSHWVKVKTSAWRKANEERWKLFEPAARS